MFIKNPAKEKSSHSVPSLFLERKGEIDSEREREKEFLFAIT
jgi:hypothetical protein